MVEVLWVSGVQQNFASLCLALGQWLPEMYAAPSACSAPAVQEHPVRAATLGLQIMFKRSSSLDMGNQATWKLSRRVQVSGRTNVTQGWSSSIDLKVGPTKWVCFA